VEDPNSSQHSQKVFDKDGSLPQSQKICTIKTTAKLQHHVNNPSSKLTQTFLCKIDLQMFDG
jgi:hypothetical protein